MKTHKKVPGIGQTSATSPKLDEQYSTLENAAFLQHVVAVI